MHPRQKKPYLTSFPQPVELRSFHFRLSHHINHFHFRLSHAPHPPLSGRRSFLLQIVGMWLKYLLLQDNFWR